MQDPFMASKRMHASGFDGVQDKGDTMATSAQSRSVTTVANPTQESQRARVGRTWSKSPVTLIIAVCAVVVAVLIQRAVAAQGLPAWSVWECDDNGEVTVVEPAAEAVTYQLKINVNGDSSATYHVMNGTTETATGNVPEDPYTVDVPLEVGEKIIIKDSPPNDEGTGAPKGSYRIAPGS